MLKKLLYSPKTTTLYPYILALTPIAVAGATAASTGTWTYTPAAWWVTFSLLMLGHGIWFYTMSANNFGKPTLYESCDEHGRPTKQAFDIAKQTYGRIHHHAHTHIKLWTAAAYIYAAALANTYGIIPAIPAIYLLSRPLSKKSHNTKTSPSTTGPPHPKKKSVKADTTSTPIYKSSESQPQHKWPSRAPSLPSSAH